MDETQYPIIAARRQAYDALLWQVPAIGIAAQGFLVSAALNKDISPFVALSLWAFAFLVGGAILYLFRQLRHREIHDSGLLKSYEESSGFAVTHGHRARLSAYSVWRAILVVMWLYSLGGIILTAQSVAGSTASKCPPTKALVPTP